MLVVTSITGGGQCRQGAALRRKDMAIDLTGIAPTPSFVIQQGFQGVQRSRIGVRAHDKIEGFVAQVGQRGIQYRIGGPGFHSGEGQLQPGGYNLTASRAPVVQPKINFVTRNAFVFRG